MLLPFLKRGETLASSPCRIAYGTPDECLAGAQHWMDAGLDQLILIPLSQNYDEIMDVFAP